MWIETKDRLPEDDIDCLVFYKGYVRHLVWNISHQVWDDSDGDDYFCDATEVTHWMPFPDAPDE